jgi:hypothetical protein
MKRTTKRVQLFRLVGIILTVLLWTSCDHAGDRSALMGYWEGTIPLPAANREEPIAYEFTEDGVTITIGLGDDAIASSWTQWEIHSEVNGDLVVHIHNIDDEAMLATMVRVVGEDELLLWDPRTEMDTTSARVRRVVRGRSSGSGGSGNGTGSGL